MNAWWRPGFLVALFLAGASTARASDDDVTVERAARLLAEISSDPKSGIRPEDLRLSVGILIVPHIVETRVGLGRKSGHGVFLSRDEKGVWGHPKPVDFSGLSAGAEAGRVVTDMVVLFRTRKGVEKYGEMPGRFFIYMGATWASRHGPRFHLHSAGEDDKDYHVYNRHHGFWLGTGLSAERKISPAFAPGPAAADPKGSTTTPVGKAADAGRHDARATREAAADHARARRLGDSPAMARLKATLAAMTTTPAQVATPGTKDANVRPAGGATPPAPSATPGGATSPAPNGGPPR